MFLEVDGVLIDRHADADRIGKELAEIKQQYPGESDDLQCKRAAVRCFSPMATEYLKALSQKVEDLAVVLSSSWRDGITVEDLKNRIFAGSFLSDLIIDKTVDSEFTAQMAEIDGGPSASECCQEKYGFALEDLRGREIDFYLREIYEKNVRVKSFVILDTDSDSEISLRYPDNYVQVDPHKLFGERDFEKALCILQNSSFSPIVFPCNEEIELRREQLA